MSAFADDSGLFWVAPTKPVKVGKSTGPRAAATPKGPVRLPPFPETEWVLPTEFPELRDAKTLSIDLETYDPDLLSKGPGVRRDGYVVGVAVGTDTGFRQYYPVRHAEGPNCDQATVLGWVRALLSRGLPIVGANLLYDLDYLNHLGVRTTGPCWDVQVAEPLIDENRRSYSLDNLSLDYLGEGKVNALMFDWAKRAFGDEKKAYANIWRMPANLVGPYAEGDVDLPLRIFELQRERLRADGLEEVFALESKLIPILLDMRARGIAVDVEHAQQMSDRCSSRYKEACKVLGGEEAVWGADELARKFDKEGIVYLKTDQGRPSFTKEWLASCEHPLAKLVLEARKLQKLNSTFIEGYVLNSHINGRIHAQFNQLRSDDSGAVSGRFSSSNPNLQNIPKRDQEFGKEVRALFIPDEGEDYGKYDWSQLEYRIMVHYAALQDLPGGKDAAAMFHDDPKTDFHSMVAKICGISRQDAKSINFGVAYGMGAAKLRQALGCDDAQARSILTQYHEKAPFIKKLSENCIDAATRRGYIRTFSGRRRRFNVWSGRDGKFYDTRERLDHEPENSVPRTRAFTHKTLNALAQGGNADLAKEAMVRFAEDGVLDVLGPALLTVHDEFGFSVPRTTAGREAFAEVKHIMETVRKLEVPLIAEGGLGPNWGEVE